MAVAKESDFKAKALIDTIAKELKEVSSVSSHCENIDS